MFICKMCSLVLDNSDLIFNHYKLLHKYSEVFECGFSTCNKKLKTIALLKKHMSFRHNSCSTESLEKKPVLSNFYVENVERENYDQVLQFSDVTNSDLVESVVTFLCKAYNKSNVTRKFIQETVEDTHELLNDILGIQGNQQIPNPFKNLLTEYKRLKYLEDSGKLIRSQKFEIGRILEDNRKKGSVMLDYRWCHAQIIPIKDVLKTFLEMGNVFSTISEYIQNDSTNKEYSSIFNGTLWKDLTIQFKGDIILPLLLYFDDFECGNPLGTQAGVHKVGGVYFTIGGIPPQFSSKLDNIFFWGLFHSSDRTTFGNDAIFSHFFDQLSHLENEGINLRIEGKNIQIRFFLHLILGDNLGINSIIGMNESFSSNNYCRFCLCSKEECSELVLEDESKLRNPNNYANHLEEKSYGIKSNCVFNKLTNFHCTVNSCVDIMHDLLEGICRYEMARILYRFIYSKKYFNLEQLNCRIKFFDFSYSINMSNRIPQISEKHIKNKYLVMSASEMMALVVNFTLLVHDLVDFTDLCWQFYLVLYDIVYFCFKSELSISEIKFLKHLIKEHHSLYKEIFSEKLKPKHHFLIHYPSVLKRVGPLYPLSSMRYEAFHKIGKTNAHIVTSRINILKTLSLRYQLRLCYRLHFKIDFVDSLTFGKSKKISCQKDFPHSLVHTKQNSEVDWVNFNGTNYRKGCAVKLHGNEFGIIIKIILTESSDIWFFCRTIPNIHFSPDIRAYTFENRVISNVVHIRLADLNIFRSFFVNTLSDGLCAINFFKTE